MNEQNIHFQRERAQDGIHDGEIVINEYHPQAHMTIGEALLMGLTVIALPFVYALFGALEAM